MCCRPPIVCAFLTLQVIANAVTNSLMELQHTKNVPVIFGVLTVLSLAQAQERAHSSLGASWGNTALCMANYKMAAQPSPTVK